MLILLITTALGADRSFHPNASEALVELSADLRLGSLPVRLTQALVVHADDPTALAAVPGVVRVQLLPGAGHVARLELTADTDELALSRALHARPDVRWAHPDFAVRRVEHAVPTDPGFASQWHLSNTGQDERLPGSDVGAERAWTRATGLGQLVAVIDSGVQLDHPELDVLPGIDLVDGDMVPGPDLELSNAPHGTASAGLIAARANGVGVVGLAYDAQIYAIRLIGGSDSFSATYTAFVDAVDAGATVLNNSWGFGENCPDIPRIGVFEDAVAYAEENGRGGLGTAVVVSAGNGNCDFSNDGWQQIEQIISVGALDGRDRREDYSSFGPLLDISAPAGGLLTTDLTGSPGYGSWQDDPDYWGGFNGTSAAAPLVSATLALMFSANDRLTVAAAREVLYDTAVRIDLEDGAYDAAGWSPWYGHGRVDAGAAVLAVANGGPEAPVVVHTAASVWNDEPILLSWTAATDPDGDALTYLVEVWPEGDKPRQGVQIETTLTEADLTELIDPNATYEWRVTPSDLWGPGPTSETRILHVPKRLARPEEAPAGCGHLPGEVGALALLGLLGLRRRRS